MKALRAEIDAKRKAQEEESSVRPTKYMRRGDVEKFKQTSSPAKLPTLTPPIPDSPREKSGSAEPSENESARITDSSKPEGYNISNEDAIRKLRARGQPIRLFAESDRDRRLRLRALELLEERGAEKGSGLNDFRRVMEHMEKGLNVEDAVKKLVGQEQASTGKESSPAGGGGAAGPEEQMIDLELIKTDPDKLYPLIYYAIKRKLKEWEQYMAERPDHIKHSVQGKRAVATQVQSGEYLKPLFKQLRQRNLPSDMLARLAEIMYYMQMRQYQRANDSYLRLSIGSAPWPIGVTMVGIHERSAREKISTDQVAHVLNDEVSRKYIQSIKRLLTFAQTKYPPADVSQLMG